MIQFDIKRFGKLAKWSMLGDKRYFVKTFLQFLVVLLVIFIFFSMVAKMAQGDPHGYKSCAIAEFAVVIVNIVLGPALMFYSMEGKHDMQTLMMLPASNFEKYLVRNAQCIVLVPLYIVAILGADLIQPQGLPRVHPSVRFSDSSAISAGRADRRQAYCLTCPAVASGNGYSL